jgi:hypothetical protein
MSAKSSDRDLRIEQFVEMQDGEVTRIKKELIESATTVKLGDYGFSRVELFAKGIQLIQR